MWLNRFYALWVLRFYYSNNPQKSEKLFHETSDGWSKDEQEKLEKIGCNYIGNDGSILGRHLTGNIIQSQIGDIAGKYMDANWGVLRSCNLEFVVPDRPVDFLAIPIAPNLCLYSKSKNMIASDEQVNFINKFVIKSSLKYYFARDLSKCLKTT